MRTKESIKQALQHEVAELISVGLNMYRPHEFPEQGLYLSGDGEMSFQYMGRQIIVKVVAAR